MFIVSERRPQVGMLASGIYLELYSFITKAEYLVVVQRKNSVGANLLADKFLYHLCLLFGSSCNHTAQETYPKMQEEMC